MLTAGVRGLGANGRTVFALYLIELLFAMTFMFFVQHALGAIYGHRPLFARGVNGDDAALIASLVDKHEALIALGCGGLAVAMIYACVSFYTTAGLVGVLAGKPFGASAGRRVLAFFRLFVWSILPVFVALVLVGIGGTTLGGSPEEVTHLGPYIGRFLLGAAPGLVILALIWCAVDYARVDLVARDHGTAFIAFMRGFRQAIRPTAFAHYALYVILWVVLVVGYVEVTFDVRYAGVVGALGLFAVRQAVAGIHLILRVMTYRRAGGAGGRAAGLDDAYGLTNSAGRSDRSCHGGRRPRAASSTSRACRRRCARNRRSPPA